MMMFRPVPPAKPPCRAWFALHVAVALSCSTGRLPAADDPAPVITRPPDSFFEWVDEGDREAARGFYAKHVDIGGLPVVAADVVADEALHRTHEIVSRMLAGRPDLLAAMARNRMYLIIIGRDQVYTDMPEHRNHPNPDYMNERVRGTGGRPTSFGEENLLTLPIDRYDDESIAVHEFCHTIDGTLRSIDLGWLDRRNQAYERAMAKGLWKDTYAASNPGEFWAEIAQCYFDCNRINNWNHGPIGTREQLRAYDPESYELVRSTFNLSPDQDWRCRPLRVLPNVIPPPERFGIDPFYTKFTWAREFPVVGRGATDEALLAANATIRRMFAYRHDVLKALINDGAKLAVLGQNERLADLPEVRTGGDGAEGIDRLSRALDYHPDLRLLAVGEENVLGDHRAALVGDGAVVRTMARALYRVTADRPVDPNWENRGREVQQYELRVRRLDSAFGERTEETWRRSTAEGRWRGTPAMHSALDFWTQGVLAYFDAAGQSAAPHDAEHPIATREALRAYDPGLFALVHETMAYGGRVDWRLGR